MYNHLVVFLDGHNLPEDVVISLDQPKDGMLNVTVQSGDFVLEKTIESKY